MRKLIRNTLNLIHDLVQLIKFSPKWLMLFEALKIEHWPKFAIVKNSVSNPLDYEEYCNIQCFKMLTAALDEIQEGCDEYAAKANGLLNKM